MRRIATVLAALAVMLAPGPALAQSSTCQTYNPQLCNEFSSTEGAAPPAASGATSAGALPFTGLDVGLLAVGGGGLLVGGVIVRARIKRLG